MAAIAADMDAPSSGAMPKSGVAAGGCGGDAGVECAEHHGLQDDQDRERGGGSLVRMRHDWISISVI
jgi:hypothetical protein